MEILPATPDHVRRYGEIYAAAFSGEPWNAPWKTADAEIHVKELLEAPTAYGLEYVEDGRILGFLVGTSMLFHYGRTFEINDLAVDPAHQKRGIGRRLLEKCLGDMKARGIAGVHLITERDGHLPAFYGQYGFHCEEDLILMGAELTDDD